MSTITSFLNAAKTKSQNGLTSIRQSVTRRTNAAEEVFSSEYMRDFIGKEIQGEGNPRLNTLMEDLTNETDPAKINQILNEMALIRGVDQAEFRAQYDEFLALRDQAKPLTPIDLSLHPDFLGSTLSLRYGTVVGDVLDIDPVFGALLNPTGGIVGPANFELYSGKTENALAYHGIFHDAAGYLDQHGAGTKYTYRDGYIPGIGGIYDFPIYDGPGDGQIAGIEWWQTEFAKNEIAEAKGEISREFKEGLGEVWSEIKDGDAKGAIKEGFEGLVGTGGEFKEGVVETTQTVTDTVAGIANSHGAEVAKDFVVDNDAKDGIADAGGWAWDNTFGRLGGDD